MFSSVLIANRGEIAARIIRTLHTLGIRSVIATSIPDRDSLAARLADGAVLLEGYSAADTYLDAGAIIAAARQTGCEAIHPGYGFLSENADFAERCAAEGIVFVGPPPSVLRALGDKASARRLAASAGVPIVPGWDGEDDDASLERAAARLGYPLVVKARGGGGGRGMRVVEDPAHLAEAIESGRREAESAFGDPGLLLERLVTGARHVEVQIVADSHGSILHLGERDCSIQRRRQKVVEEAPSPVVDEHLRNDLTSAAQALARSAGYLNAGTFEFLVGEPAADGRRPFFFLEVNPRLQVEHPVTELITGLDLVELQMRVAAGEPLPIRQHEVRFAGHAIEFRVNAEDPDDDFRPSAGRIHTWLRHEDPPEWRQDAGYDEEDVVPAQYDSLLAKSIVHRATRDECLESAGAMIGPGDVRGVHTNLGLLQAIARSDDFRAGRTDTTWLERNLEGLLAAGGLPDEAFVAASVALGTVGGAPAAGAGWLGPGHRTVWLTDGLHVREVSVQGGRGRAGSARLGGRLAAWNAAARLNEGRTQVRVDEETMTVLGGADEGTVTVIASAGYAGDIWVVPPPSLPRRAQSAAAGVAQVTAPLAGTVAAVGATEGAAVTTGDLLVVLDAMKMEHRIVAPADGTVVRVAVRERDVVRQGDLLVEMA